MKNEIELNWIKFSKWSDVTEDEDGKYQFPCVYVLAERDGKPMYIGMTTRKPTEKDGKLYAGGLRARYFHDYTVLDACMKGTGRHLFIAKVDPRKARVIEKQLIFENKPEYNNNGKDKAPERTVKLIHKGMVPKFKES